MNNKLFRTNFQVILFVSFLFISYIICSFAVSKSLPYSDTGQLFNKIYILKTNSVNRIKSPIEKLENNQSNQKIFIDVNSKILQTNVFDEELYKRYLNSFFGNSMLFAAFLAFAILLFKVLKKYKRLLFEEPHFKHILILMKYIHRMDGEWGIISLNHSFFLVI